MARESCRSEGQNLQTDCRCPCHLVLKTVWETPEGIAVFGSEGVPILFASRLLKEYHLMATFLAWYVRTRMRFMIKEVCDTGKSGTVS